MIFNEESLRKGINMGLGSQGIWTPELENIMFNEISNQSLSKYNVSHYLLPTKSIIDKVIIEKYINMYGTNYDEYSLVNARKGALIIVDWILNNQ